jgi:hypothetical protein
MELQSLRLLVTDDDLKSLAAHHLPRDTPIEDLCLAFTAEGVRVTGTYPVLIMNVSFETIWSLLVIDGQAEARLTTLRVAGFPAGKFKGIILKMIRDELHDKPGVTMVDEGIRFDLEAVVRQEGVSLRANLKALHCEAGRLIVEAG